MRSTRLARALALIVTTLAVAVSPLIAAEAVGVLGQISGNRLLIQTKGAAVNVMVTPNTQVFINKVQVPKKKAALVIQNLRPGTFLKVEHERGKASKVMIKKGQ